MHGKPSYLPLERLRSASKSLRLERFRSFCSTGATPVRLLDTPNTTCLSGPCHRLSSMNGQSPDMRDRVLGREALHSALSGFFLEGSGRRE